MQGPEDQDGHEPGTGERRRHPGTAPPDRTARRPGQPGDAFPPRHRRGLLDLDRRATEAVREQGRLVRADDQPQRLAGRRVEPRQGGFRRRGTCGGVPRQGPDRRLLPPLGQPRCQGLQRRSPRRRTRHLAGDAPPGERPGGIHVGGWGERSAVQDLWGDETLSAERIAGRLTDEARHPEVRQEWSARTLDQHVARGHVAVHHPCGVQACERPGDGSQDGHRLPDAEVATRTDDALQRPTTHVVEDQGDPRLVAGQGHHLVEAHQAFHLDATEHRQLANRGVRVLPRRDCEDLDRHLHAVAVTPGRPHDRAAADPQSGAERVARHPRRR